MSVEARAARDAVARSKSECASVVEYENAHVCVCREMYFKIVQSVYYGLEPQRVKYETRAALHRKSHMGETRILILKHPKTPALSIQTIL